MTLNTLSLSFTADEVMRGLKTAIAKQGGQVPPEIDSLDISIKKGQLLISMKKKLGFMPVTFSVAITLRPADGGEGVVVTLAKISAGFVGSQAIAAQILSQIGQSLQNVPGCSVSGNDITFTKAALAVYAPWLNVLGSVKTFNVIEDRVEIALG